MATSLEPKALLRALRGEAIDRPVVICPGGMMSMAVTEVMDLADAPWPEAHTDAGRMAALALAMHRETGTDNVAAPFCMTVEAEAYGMDIHMGSKTVQPRAGDPILPNDGAGELPSPDFRSGRAGVLLDALRRLRAESRVTVVGNVVGPVSLLGMLADPLFMLRWARRDPDTLTRHMATVTDALCDFAVLQVEAGAEVMCIAEPTGTGEILGGPAFGRFVLPCLNRIADAVRGLRVPVIVHICGDVTRIERELLDLRADAFSVDCMVDLPALIRRKPPWLGMGNISSFLLEAGPPTKVVKHTRALVQAGVRLIAPACGIVPDTPAANLRAMREGADTA